MRKSLLLFAVAVLPIMANAQTILSNQSHGFVPNEINPMKITNYVDPGVAGKNVVWDFSNLEVTKTFVGSIYDSFVSKCCSLFPQGNVVLKEFGNYFVFDASDSKLLQYGFLSSTGSTQIVYHQPFVKMQYPFTYGSNFNGVFDGDYLINGKIEGQLSGNYKVDGDATGSLILPGGKELNNVLRVKEVKTTKQVLNDVVTNIEDVTYRWYVQNYRFPVLVLIKSTYLSANGVNPSEYTKAAYNSDVMNAITNVKQVGNDIAVDIYPNPYRGQVTIAYKLDENSNVNLSVFDLSGRLIKVLVNGKESEGEKKYQFSAVELGNPAGAYIVKLQVNGKETSRKIVELK